MRVPSALWEPPAEVCLQVQPPPKPPHGRAPGMGPGGAGVGRTETAEPSGGGARRDWQRWLCVQRHARGERGGRRRGCGDGGPSAARGPCGAPGRCCGAVGKPRQGRRGRRSGGAGGGMGTRRPAGGSRRRPHTALRRRCTAGWGCAPARTIPHPPGLSAGSGSGGARGALCRLRSSVRGGLRGGAAPRLCPWDGVGRGAALRVQRSRPWHRSRHRVPVPQCPPGRPRCGVPRCHRPGAAPRCPHGAAEREGL